MEENRLGFSKDKVFVLKFLACFESIYEYIVLDFIIIKKPWWQTWVFRISTILVLSFLTWFVIYQRIKRIREKQKAYYEQKVQKTPTEKFSVIFRGPCLVKFE